MIYPCHYAFDHHCTFHLWWGLGVDQPIRNCDDSYQEVVNASLEVLRASNYFACISVRAENPNASSLAWDLLKSFRYLTDRSVIACEH